MSAAATLLPVFVMMALGFLARSKGWIRPEAKEGAKDIAFQMLFPFLIFHAIFRSELHYSMLWQILFLLVAWSLIFLIGRLAIPLTGRRFAHISSYLLLTCEGGSVALPLYISLVGDQHVINIVTFDVAGILINFIFVPIMVSWQSKQRMRERMDQKEAVMSEARETGADAVLSLDRVARLDGGILEDRDGRLSAFALLREVLTNSFLIAVALGLLGNVLGLYRILTASHWFDSYTQTMNMIIAPITGLILFTLGYDLKIHKDMLFPLLRLFLLRILTCGGIIAGFFLLFPDRMADSIFRIGVLLYFMCPPGFPVPLQINALLQSEEDEGFVSAFMSLTMILGLLVYVFLALFA